MIELRITKYNPAFRGPNGVYLRNEWISASDIGSRDDDGLVTYERYMRTENAYVEAAILFLKAYGVQTMTIESLEEGGALENPLGHKTENESWLKKVSPGFQYSYDRIEQLIRLSLREACWVKLKGEKNSYIHFGHDYYMYIGIDVDKGVKKEISFPSTLFVEDCTSPYRYPDTDLDE
jgi:hypothetical protein